MKKCRLLMLVVVCLAQVGTPVSAEDQCEPILGGASSALAEKLAPLLWRATAAEKNVLYSPFNIASAVSLLLPGAAGGTHTEIAGLLGLEPSQELEFLAAQQALRAELAREDTRRTTLLRLGTSLWANTAGRGFRFHRIYTGTVREAFGARLGALSFDQPDALGTINRWGEELTDGLIPEVLDSLPSDVKAVLIATLLIQGKWVSPFTVTKTVPNQLFRGLHGAEVRVPLMTQTDRLPYFRDSRVQVVRLRTMDGEAYLEVLLPVSGRDHEVAKARQDFLSHQLTVQDENILTRNVELFLPRFRVEFEEDLSELLGGLIPTTMSAGADLSRMGTPAVGISSVVHKTALEVNEYGMRAAAATAATARATSIREPQDPIEMRVDRSFGVRIVWTPQELVDTYPSGMELFRGWVEAPEPLEAPDVIHEGSHTH